MSEGRSCSRATHNGAVLEYRSLSLKARIADSGRAARVSKLSYIQP